MALCFISDFDFAGHTSTHTPQPVQSSGATWIVSSRPGWSCDRNRLLGTRPVRCRRRRRRVVDLHADRRVRAHERAAGAVDADLGIPDRDLGCERALLVRGQCRSGTCRRPGAHSPGAGHLRRRASRGDPLDEVGRVGAATGDRVTPGGGDRRGRDDELQRSRAPRRSRRGWRRRPAPPRLPYTSTDRGPDGGRARRRAASRLVSAEAADLHDHVDLTGEADVAGDAVRVDHVDGRDPSRGSTPAPLAADGPRWRRPGTGCSAGSVAPGAATSSTSTRSRRPNW